MSGADLANLVNEAALIAGKRGQPALMPDMLDEAMDKAVMGGERKCVPWLSSHAFCAACASSSNSSSFPRGLAGSGDFRKCLWPADNGTCECCSPQKAHFLLRVRKNKYSSVAVLQFTKRSRGACPCARMVRSLEARRLTAYHEAGHALVAVLTPGANDIHKATIVPRGHALGLVSQARLPSLR